MRRAPGRGTSIALRTDADLRELRADTRNLEAKTLRCISDRPAALTECVLTQFAPPANLSRSYRLRAPHAKRVKILLAAGGRLSDFLRKPQERLLAPPLLRRKHKSGDSVDGLGPVRGLFATKIC
jgi:hypothetical protein